MRQWEGLPLMNTRRSWCAAASDGDLLYAVGGWDEKNHELDTAEVWDSRTHQWTDLPPMTIKRRACAAAVIGGKLYVVGGCVRRTWLDSAEVYDPLAGSWTPLSPMNSRRGQCAAAALGDELYVAGGCDGRSALASAEAYDPRADEWRALPLMGGRRNACAAAASGRALYVFGGGDGSSILDSAEAYDAGSRSWSALPRMGSRRWACAAAAFGERLYVFGGNDGTVRHDSAEAYDAGARSWSALPRMGSKRGGCAAARVQGQIAVVGGYSGSMIFNTVEMFTPMHVSAGSGFGDEVSCGRETLRSLIDAQDLDPRPVPLLYLKQCTNQFSDEARIGEGSYSEVYVAKDAVLRRKFAVKRFRIKFLALLDDIKEAKRTFEVEIKTLTHFRHPNISRLYAYCISPELQGEHCLVFQYAANGSLYDFLKYQQQRERLHWTTRINVALGISKAVHYLHKGTGGQICFHRDIKAANVCLKRDFTALLIDCGVSKMVPLDDSQCTLTMMETSGNRARGTPGYMCPDYARRLDRYIGSYDVYSLGIVFAEMISGILQFSNVGGRKIDLFDQYSDGSLECRQLELDADENAGVWDNHICKEFSQLTVQCISYIPGKRPSIGSVVDRLENLTSMARPWSPGERNRMIVLTSDPLVYKVVDEENNTEELHPISSMLDFKRERQLLEQCFADAGRDIELVFDVATDDRLQAAVTKRYSCLHFSGHGHPEALIFEDGLGGLHVFDEDKLYDVVHSEPFRFAFVSACFSLSMGRALVKAGVPHVVCSEHDAKLNDLAAIKFTNAFYHALANGYTVQASFEKGRAAVSTQFNQVEVDKFVLLPENENHEQPIFDAEELEWNDSCATEQFIPLPPQNFLGRELDVYRLLGCILSQRLVTLTGDEGVGCSSLASAACNYLSARKTIFLEIEHIYFLQSEDEGQRSDTFASFIDPLHQQLLDEGLAKPIEDPATLASYVHSVVDAVAGTPSLIVLDGVDSHDEELMNFMALLFRSTNTVKILLVTTKPNHFASFNVEETQFHLEPLGVEKTVDLFLTVCQFAEGTETERDLLLANLCSSDHTTFDRIGGGVPGRTIWAAKNVSKEGYDELFVGGV